MDVPFRLRVLMALTALYKTITPANGYQHDLRDFAKENGKVQTRVFRGVNRFGFGDPRPMVSILEDPRVIEQLLGTAEDTSSTGGWRLVIQGFVQDDKDNPTDPAHYLAADVVKATVKAKKDRFNILGFGDTMPCITGLEIGAPSHQPADDEISEVAFFFMPLTLTLVEDLENPFA